MSRGTLLLLVVTAVVYFGWQGLSRTSNETVVLRIPPTDLSQDTYVHLWVVEDAQGLWLRAESPDRLWLRYLSDSPVVELRRHDKAQKYIATVDDTPRARNHVGPMFRAKYGFADEARALLGRQSVPVRLLRR
jgi:hypothetical protein